MTEPLTTSIATALATGATAALSDGVRVLITKLASLVRERLRRNPSDQDALDAAARAPGDNTTVHRLAEALGRNMRDDPVFGEQLRSLWSDIAAEEARHHDRMTNVVSGRVSGSVVQARDVQGGITLHASPSRGSQDRPS